MKRFLCFVSLAFYLSFASSAQSNNSILFTENGEKFQIILNGILQNSTPQTNVKLTGLNAPNYKCRIMFEDTKLGYLDWNMFFPKMGEEVTWNIKRNSKGKFVTRYVSDVEVVNAPPTPPTQTVVIFTTTPAVSTTSTTIHQSQTVTTTNNGPTTDHVNINMGINTGDQGGQININASGIDANEPVVVVVTL